VPIYRQKGETGKLINIPSGYRSARYTW